MHIIIDRQLSRLNSSALADKFDHQNANRLRGPPWTDRPVSLVSKCALRLTANMPS